MPKLSWKRTALILLFLMKFIPAQAESTECRFGRGWQDFPAGSPEQIAAITIEQEIYRYTYAIDTRDWDNLADLFAATGFVTMHGSGNRELNVTVKEWFAAAYNGVDATPSAQLLYSRHNVSPRSFRFEGDTAVVQSDLLEELLLVNGRRVVLQRGGYDDVWVKTPLGWRMAERKISLNPREPLEVVDALEQPERIWDYPELWAARGDRLPRPYRIHPQVTAEVFRAWKAELESPPASAAPAEAARMLACPRVDVLAPDTARVTSFWSAMDGKKVGSTGRYVDIWTLKKGAWQRTSRTTIVEMVFHLPQAESKAPWWQKP